MSITCTLHRPTCRLPATLSPFLTSCGSLTRLLSSVYGVVNVEIVCENYRTLSMTEWQNYCQLAGQTVKKTQIFWVREIFLLSNGKRLVHAKTLLPVCQLQGKLHRLKHLGNTPMGHILFNKHKKLPFIRQFISKDNQYARQSLYDWYGSSVFVEEWFLTHS